MISLVFSLAAQVVETVTRPWRNLIWYALHLYVAAWGVLLNCSLKLVSAPFRILTAIQRQSLVQHQPPCINRPHFRLSFTAVVSSVTLAHLCVVNASAQDYPSDLGRAVGGPAGGAAITH